MPYSIDVPEIMSNIYWVFPVGCDENCRSNLRSFLNSLDKDLNDKVTILYLTDVGLNR